MVNGEGGGVTLKDIQRLISTYPFAGHWEIPMLKVEELLNKFPLKHVLFYY
jgi:hypothetical protein